MGATGHDKHPGAQPPNKHMDENPHVFIDPRHDRFETEKLHLRQLLIQIKQSFEEPVLSSPDKNVYRLALVESLNDIGFQKAIEEYSITVDTIATVESIHNQLVSAALHTTKQVVTLPKLSNLHSISDFQD